MTQDLAPLLLEKLREQVERLDHRLALIPPGARTSAALPIRNAMPLDMLLGHLLECLAGVCATLQAAYPERLAHFTRLRTLPVNHRCGVREAWRRRPEMATMFATPRRRLMAKSCRRSCCLMSLIPAASAAEWNTWVAYSTPAHRPRS
ncbi:MAG TPA: hypothetical protein VLT62_03515 [Candidatus Methylomirabilis sp.]|nr:hypothetical protein [Candidatus Methylomirabilis sp.]